MTSPSIPIPAQARKPSRTRAAVHALPLRAAFIAFIAVVILFRWLHLIVSLQIASTNRQIQMGQDELAKYDRTNAALLFAIAEATSPRSLALRAQELGYRPQAPDYVASDQPMLPAGEDTLSPSLAEQVLGDLSAPDSEPSESPREAEQE